jgi:hypothetical protein
MKSLSLCAAAYDHPAIARLRENAVASIFHSSANGTPFRLDDKTRQVQPAPSISRSQAEACCRRWQYLTDSAR